MSNSLESAMNVYNEMITSLRKGESCMTQLSGDGHLRRQLVYLPDEPLDGTATWDDLFTQKIIFDLGFSNVDLVEGRVHKLRCTKDSKIMDHLRRLLDSLLKGLTKEEQEKFKNKNGEYNVTTLGLIFGFSDTVSHYQRNWNKNDHSTETHLKIIKGCLAGALNTRNRKVTNELAKEVFKSVQKEVKEEKSRLSAQKKLDELQLIPENGDTTKTPQEIKEINSLRASKLNNLLMGTPPQNKEYEIGCGPDSFTVFLKKEIEEPGYLDYRLHGMTTYKDDHDSIPHGEGQRPKVHAKVTKPDCDNIQYTVWMLEQLLSPEFEKDLWEWRINEQTYTKGKAGRSNSFVRMFSTSEQPLHMVIAKDNVYETLIGNDLSDLDKDLMIVADYLCSLQRKFLMTRLSETEPDFDDKDPLCVEKYVTPITQKLGHLLLAPIVYCGYGVHSDQGPSVNNPVTQLWSEQRPLPTAGDQQTLTMSSQSQENGEIILSWKDKMGNLVLKTTLKGSIWHWQGPLMQQNLTHSVESNGITNRQHLRKIVNRLMVSFRPANNPSEDEDWYWQRLEQDAKDAGRKINLWGRKGSDSEYRITNILDKLSDPTYDFELDNKDNEDGKDPIVDSSQRSGTDNLNKDTIGKTTVSSVLESAATNSFDVCDTNIDNDWLRHPINKYYDIVRNSEYSDKYGHITEKRFTEHGIERPQLLFKSYESLDFLAANATLVAECAEKGYFVRTYYPDPGDTPNEKKGFTVPALQCLQGNILPIVGQDFKQSTVCSIVNIKANNRSHDVCNKKDDLVTIDPTIILWRSYKNVFDRSLLSFFENSQRYHHEFNEYMDRNDIEGASAVKLWPDDNEWMTKAVGIGGLAGSTQQQGTYAPTLSDATSDQTFGTVYASQKSKEPMHDAFSDHIEKRRIVPMYLNPYTFFNKKKNSEYPDRLFFIGYFYFCYSFHGREPSLDIEKYLELAEEYDVEELQNLSFLMSGHFRFWLLPAFTSQQNSMLMRRQLYNKTNSKYGWIEIPMGCEDHVAARVPQKLRKASVEFGKDTVDIDRLIKLWVQADGFKKYIVEKTKHTDEDDEGTYVIEQEKVVGEASYEVDKVTKKASALEILDAGAFNQVSGCYRGLGYNVEEDANGNPVCGPIKKKKASALSGAFAIHPRPMTNRQMDVNIDSLFESYKHHGIIPDGSMMLKYTDTRILNRAQEDDLIEKITEALSMSILNTFLGMPNVWRVFQQDYLKKGHNAPATIPTLSEIPKFLEFLKTTCKKDCNKYSISHLISGQFRKHLPKCIQFLPGFRKFALNMMRDIKNYVISCYQPPQVLVQNEIGGLLRPVYRQCHEQLVIKLQEWIGCGDKVNLKWFTQVCIQGAGEGTQLPFGEIKSEDVQFGPGGVYCADLMKNHYFPTEEENQEDEYGEDDEDDESILATNDNDEDDDEEMENNEDDEYSTVEMDQDSDADALRQFMSSFHESSSPGPTNGDGHADNQSRRKRRLQRQKKLPAVNKQKKRFLKKFHGKARKKAKKKKDGKLSPIQCAELLLETLRMNRERYEDGLFFALFWDEDLGDFRHIRNKRRVNLVDAEHWLCKGYICYILTTPSRYLSVMPQFWKPWCHPASKRCPLWKRKRGHNTIQDIMYKIVEKFEDLNEKNDLLIEIPYFALYDNELKE